MLFCQSEGGWGPGTRTSKHRFWLAVFFRIDASERGQSSAAFHLRCRFFFVATRPRMLGHGDEGGGKAGWYLCTERPRVPNKAPHVVHLVSGFRSGSRIHRRVTSQQAGCSRSWRESETTQRRMKWDRSEPRALGLCMHVPATLFRFPGSYMYDRAKAR